MNTPTNIKYPPNLVLIAVLSGGLTIGLSLIYILLCITFIAFRFNCDAISSTTSTSAGYFWQTIFKVYGLSSSCEDAISIQRLTHESTVLTLVSLILAFSVISLVAAIGLISIVQDEKHAQYINWLVYVYIGSCVATLIVDVTTASHFGVDFNFLTSLLRELAPNSEANYQIDVLRQGALFLMIVVLKGFIPPLINCILLILLVIYLVDYQKLVRNNEHPIHKVGVLNAFDQKKNDENWVQPDLYNRSPFSRGPQINSAFIDDDSPPRSPVRRPDPPRSDYYSNRSFESSNSWTRSQNTTPQNGRVFSYLEDIRKPVPPPKAPHTHSPSADKSSSWRRDRDPWSNQAPPVPAPDYSPPQPRRLKSALKPGYM